MKRHEVDLVAVSDTSDLTKVWIATHKDMPHLKVSGGDVFDVILKADQLMGGGFIDNDWVLKEVEVHRPSLTTLEVNLNTTTNKKEEDKHKHYDMIVDKAANMELVNSKIESDYYAAKESYLRGKTNQVSVGQVIKSVGGCDFEVVHIHCRFLCLVRFCVTGNLAITGCGNAKSGKVKNRYKKSLSGVGFLGYGEFNPKDHNKFYAAWSSHIAKCYDESHRDFHKYGALGWKVCDEWHNFQNFASWCNSTCSDHSLLLDKDRNDGGLRVIRPQSCEWVLPHENIESGRLSKLTSHCVKEIRAKYLEGGVSMRGLAKEYAVDCSVICNIINNKAWKNA